MCAGCQAGPTSLILIYIYIYQTKEGKLQLSRGTTWVTVQDDPLSALDAKVAQEVFTNAIVGEWASK